MHLWEDRSEETRCQLADGGGIYQESDCQLEYKKMRGRNHTDVFGGNK